MELKYELEKLGDDVDSDFFEQGVMSVHDLKLKIMRRKLNYSVDLASIREKNLKREKVKYEEYAAYKSITKVLTYDNDEFMGRIERATDPKNGPIIPAEILRMREEEARKVMKMREDGEDLDIYAPRLPIVEGFNSKNKGKP